MKMVELFAGAGGLGLGLEKCGFEPALVVEWDKWCCDTLKENKASDSNGWNIEMADVRDVNFSDLTDVSLVSGGPPCQPFSLGGRHKAVSDKRDMFPEAVRAVRELQPKAFVFENVKGLTRRSFQNYFQYIQLQLEHPELTAKDEEDWSCHLRRLEQHHLSKSRVDLHYRTVTRVLNAADYGVPQSRERVFIVGFRDDMDVDWSFPAATHSKDSLAWDQNISNDYWEKHNLKAEDGYVDQRLEARASKLDERPSELAWNTVRDAIKDLPDPRLHNGGFDDHVHQPGARAYKGHTGSPIDLPSKTLKAGVHGVPGGENMVVFPDGSMRYLTVRESARVQTFPDSHRFKGSWSESMRQLGNAVPVDLAEAVGRGVARELYFA